MFLFVNPENWRNDPIWRAYFQMSWFNPKLVLDGHQGFSWFELVIWSVLVKQQVDMLHDKSQSYDFFSICKAQRLLCLLRKCTHMKGFSTLVAPKFGWWFSYRVSYISGGARMKCHCCCYQSTTISITTEVQAYQPILIWGMDKIILVVAAKHCKPWSIQWHLSLAYMYIICLFLPFDDICDLSWCIFSDHNVHNDFAELRIYNFQWW